MVSGKSWFLFNWIVYWIADWLGLGGNQGGRGGRGFVNKNFSQNKFCREGAYLRGFVIQKKYFLQKEFCRKGAYLRGFVIQKNHFLQKSFAAKVPIQEVLFIMIKVMIKVMINNTPFSKVLYLIVFNLKNQSTI